jgi:flagellar biosynthesis protein FliR
MMFQVLGTLLDLSEEAATAFALVFVRVGGVMFLLPGFGEQGIPARVRLGLTLAFALVVWPLLAAEFAMPAAGRPFLFMLVLEALIGVLLGLSLRLMVFALQFAGSVAAQSTSLAQLLGPGATPDPMPAIGNILMLAGVTLAVAGGLHVKAAVAMARSYEILPMGLGLAAGDVAAWGTARTAAAFSLGFSMAAPFVIAGFAYNLALGAINRAMPSLMVAFIGAPAIIAGAILLLLLASPLILTFWTDRLDLVLADPLAMPR